MNQQTRETILFQAKEAVTKDRQATYGKPEDSFQTIANYWSVHLNMPVSATDVSIMLGLLKMARLKANPHHMDNWVDLAGYAACGGEIAADEKPVPAEPAKGLSGGRLESAQVHKPKEGVK